MKLFKDVVEEIRARNRAHRFTGKMGLVIYIAAVLILLYIIKDINKGSVENMFRIFGVELLNR